VGRCSLRDVLYRYGRHGSTTPSTCQKTVNRHWMLDVDPTAGKLAENSWEGSKDFGFQ